MSETDKGTARIAAECDAIKALLLAKHKAYGDNFENPIRVFSSADNIEQLRVKIDDKLTRMRNLKPEDDDEDTVLDLIGYLVLLRVATKPVKPVPEEVIEGIPQLPQRQYAGAGPRNRWDYPQAQTDYFRGQSSKKGEK